MRIVQKVLSSTKSFDSLSLSSTEIKTEICISFSSLTKTGSVLLQQKYSTMTLLTFKNFLNDSCDCVCMYIYILK